MKLLKLHKKLVIRFWFGRVMCSGGQSMRIVINDDEVEKAVVSLLKHIPGNKILIDHFLDRCQEAEIDAIFDGEDFHVMGVMEHIEPAGIHSGDSNAVLPALILPRWLYIPWKIMQKKLRGP